MLHICTSYALESHNSTCSLDSGAFKAGPSIHHTSTPKSTTSPCSFAIGVKRRVMALTNVLTAQHSFSNPYLLDYTVDSGCASHGIQILKTAPLKDAQCSYVGAKRKICMREAGNCRPCSRLSSSMELLIKTPPTRFLIMLICHHPVCDRVARPDGTPADGAPIA